MHSKSCPDTRYNPIEKLARNKWGTKSWVLRTSAQVLCFFTGEYASPVWWRSIHSTQVDIALNQKCRIITGCRKVTIIDKLYTAVGLFMAGGKKNIQQICRQVQTNNWWMPCQPYWKLRESILHCAALEPSDIRAEFNLNWKTLKTLNRIRTVVASLKTNLNGRPKRTNKAYA